jgi:hypothetical protein
MNEMWEALERYQPYADKHGFGPQWLKMTTERTAEAARAAWAAAVARATWAAEAAAWAAVDALTVEILDIIEAEITRGEHRREEEK